MVTISRRHLEQLFQQAAAELPNECCGILAGLREDRNIVVTEVFPMENLDKSAEHFSIEPRALFSLHRELRSKGLSVLGNYHSHPATPARPSVEDIRLAYDPDAVYVIISLKEEIPVLKAFYIREGVYQELPVELINTLGG